MRLSDTVALLHVPEPRVMVPRSSPWRDVSVSGLTTLAVAVVVIVAAVAGASGSEAAAAAAHIAVLESQFPTSALAEPETYMVTARFTKVRNSKAGLRDG